MVQETSMKKLHSEERKEPYNTLNRTEQTILNKNWVKNSHRKERGIKEMDPSYEEALAEKAKNWMDPSSTNNSEDNH